ILTAGIDLSIGTGMALTAVVAVGVVTNIGLPWYLGALAGVLFGGLIGAGNGSLVSVAKLPPFISTLAMTMVAEGLARVFSGTAPFYIDREGDGGYTALSTGELLPGVPNAVLIFAIISIIAGIVLGRTILGRYAFAIG